MHKTYTFKSVWKNNVKYADSSKYNSVQLLEEHDLSKETTSTQGKDWTIGYIFLFLLLCFLFISDNSLIFQYVSQTTIFIS